MPTGRKPGAIADWRPVGVAAGCLHPVQAAAWWVQGKALVRGAARFRPQAEPLGDWRPESSGGEARRPGPCEGAGKYVQERASARSYPTWPTDMTGGVLEALARPRSGPEGVAEGQWGDPRAPSGALESPTFRSEA
jgi:hypothetical protein